MVKFVSLFVQLFFMSFFFFSMAVESGEKTHICFFELDNTTTSRNFKNKIDPDRNNRCHKRQEFKKQDTVVHCYQPRIGENERGRKAFERMISDMINKGERCDSLVFSGHHAGDWFGKTGTLWLKDMEALSCNSKYKDWFSSIKALWLDGCNTVTDDFIQSDKERTPLNQKSIIRTSDSETVRLADGKDKVGRDYINRYQQSYSGSLDENTPLSSRYLRMFPNTQIYGFNGVAPTGEEKNKSSFIYEHLSLVGRALSAEEKYSKIKTDFKRGLAVFSSLDDYCDEEKMKNWQSALNGWGNVSPAVVERQDYKQAYKLGCDLILAKQVLDDPEASEAQEALARHIQNQNNKQNLPRAKQRVLDLANQILHTASSAEEKKNSAIELAKMSIVETLKSINEEDAKLNRAEGGSELNLKNRYTHLLFNNIYDTWNTAKKYKNKDRRFFNAVKSEFRKEGFTEPLKKRIKSPVTASLKKGDYLKFYAEIYEITGRDIQDIREKGVCKKVQNSYMGVKKRAYTAQNSKRVRRCFVANHVEQLVKKAASNFSELQSPRNRNLSDKARKALAVSVADQLFQYGFLNGEQINGIMKKLELTNPERIKNPFFMDVKWKMDFSLNPDIVLSTLEDKKPDSFQRKSAIRAGAGMYVDQFNKYNSLDGTEADEAKKQLSEIADRIELTSDKYRDKRTDYYAFFLALNEQLKLRKPEEQADFLLAISRNTGRNLEKIAILSASAMFQEEPAAKEYFCSKWRQEKNSESRQVGSSYCTP